jgi:hypothetical protein
MANPTTEFWEWPDLLAGPKERRDPRQAWRLIGLGDNLLTACRQEVTAREPLRLAHAWDALQAADVEHSLGSLRRERAWFGLDVDVGRLLRGLRGTVAAALAARAVLAFDTDELLRWVHEAARQWGDTTPTEGLLEPLSLPTPGTGAARPNALQLAQLLDEHFRVLGWERPGQWRVGAARDCVRHLLGVELPVEERRTMPVLTFAGEGRVLQLSLELLRDGTGDCYPATDHLGLLPMASNFLAAAETAWAAACRAADGRPAHLDVRWWVGGGPLEVLEGGSMGAALAVAFTQVLRRQPIDPECALTATIDAAGALGSVEHVYQKVLAALTRGRLRRVVVCADRVSRRSVDVDQARDAARAAGLSEPEVADAVRPAADLREAIDQSAGLLRDLERYYLALKKATEVQLPEAGGRTLNDLYVPPEFKRLSPDNRDRDEDALYRDHEQSPRVTWETARREWALPCARVVVQGSPGEGKSVLTQMLARAVAVAGLTRLADRGQAPRLAELPLPVVVKLNVLLGHGLPEGRPPAHAFRAALAATLTDAGGDTPDLVRYLVEHAHAQRTWLILDGLDEVSDADAVAWERLARLLLQPQWESRVLITSRPYGFARQAQGFQHNVLVFRLVDLSPEQQRALIARRLGAVPPGLEALLRRSPNVQNMARNANLLALLCHIAQKRTVPADVTRTDIYGWALEDFLGSANRADEWKACLQAVAWQLFRTDPQDLLITREDLREFLADPESQRPRVLGRSGAEHLSPVGQADELIDELEKRRLLVPVGASARWMFSHRSIAEFLAARYLARRVRAGWQGATVPWSGRQRPVAELLDEKAWLPEWQEVFVFLGGLLAEPRPLLELLTDRQKGDDLGHRLALASRVLAEATPAAPGSVKDL